MLAQARAVCGRSTEQRFMEASMAYSAKKPIMSDADYDDLKKKLRKQNSRVVQQARWACGRTPVHWTQNNSR